MDSATFYEDVRRRAFEIYQERGGTHGNDQSDWLRAETELRSQNTPLKHQASPSPGIKRGRKRTV